MASAGEGVWRIELLGGLRARHGDVALDRFPTRKTAALLALLAAYPGRRFTREQLIDLLWPDADLDSGRDRLNHALTYLRTHLEPPGTVRGSVLVTDRMAASLNPARIATDAADFERALADAARPGLSPGDVRAALTGAVDRYRGELLPGFYEDWAVAERQRLLAAYLAALRRLAEMADADGDRAAALTYARRALDADPLSDDARALAEQLQQQGLQAPAATGGAGGEKAAPGLPAADRRREPAAAAFVPLPAPLTRFFGREAEMTELRRMLAEGARLITLFGPGGAGKTRLALEAGALLAPSFGGAVAFAPLADLGSAASIPAAIAGALRLPPAAGIPPLDQVADRLAERPALLILDNLEHLVPDASPAIRELLVRAPGLTVVATSRRRLALEGEHALEVPPLTAPPPGPVEATVEGLMGIDSVQLFVDRARAVNPAFRLNAQNAGDVARICARLEGIPLAIELCAAWAPMLTPQQMLEKLDRRFDLLVSRRADISDRHRSLRAALEYSWLQLPPDLRQLFARLSVFRGGWTVDAAARVADTGPERESMATLGRLAELRERSLILAGEQDGEMRYSLLDTLREFGEQQLAFTDTRLLRRAHAAYYTEFAERAETGLTGAAQETWLRLLDAEQENLRAALGWCVEAGDTEDGLRLASALHHYWYSRARTREGIEWLRAFLDAAGTGADTQAAVVPAGVLARAWNALGYLTWAQGDYPAARGAHERALALRRESGDRAGEAESLYQLGITAFRMADYDTARALLGEGLTLAQSLGDDPLVSRILLNLGNLAGEQQRYDDAREFYRRTLDLSKRLGNRMRMGSTLNNLGVIAQTERDLPGAERLFEEALAISREMRDSHGIAVSLLNLGSVERERGERTRSHALLSEGLALAAEGGQRDLVAYYLLHLGLLAAADGDSRQSVRLLASALRLREVLGGTFAPIRPEEYEQALTAARTALGSSAYDALWREGRTAPVREIVAHLLDGAGTPAAAA